MAHRLQFIISVAAAMAAVSVVQPAVAQVTQINRVQVNTVNGVLEVRLTTTDGSMPQTFTSGYGETVVIDLVNTQLNLAAGDAIVQDNPAAGIASIQVAALEANSVRITITGQEQAPTATLVQDNGELVVSVSTADAVADQVTPAPADETTPELEAPATDDAIRIIVTDEQPGSAYLAPETTAGTRTESSIFEIPQTIQVLPEQLIEDQQITRLEEAILNVPNAVSGNLGGGGGEEFVIRGFRSATIFRDGFRGTIDRGALQGATELANVERIEVLSGPASVLYGNAEPGGIVNVVTKQPQPEFFAEVGVQVGSFGFVRPTFDVSGPLTAAGNLRYRLNAAYEFSDDFRDYETESERFFVAPVIAWQISDRTTLTFDLEYRDETLPFDRGLIAFFGEVIDAPLDTIFGDEEDFIDIEVLTVGYRLDHEFSDNWQLRNRFRYGTSDYETRRAIPAAILGGGNIGRVFFSNDSESQTFESQTELIGEFTTGSIEHTLLFGVDVFFSDINTLNTNAPAPPINIFDPQQPDPFERPRIPLTNVVADREANLSQIGVILQDQIQIVPNLTLLLGGRLDFVSQQAQDEFLNTDVAESYTNFSPRVGLVYQPVEPLFLYASYSQSFFPNNSAFTTVDGELLAPEEAEQFEIGVKAELLGGRLAATLALFDITRENVAAADPNNIGASIPIGEQTSRGLELVVQGEILPGWNVVASYGLLDSEITESGGAFPEGATPGNVPENTASLYTSYEIQAGDLAGLGFGLGVFFVDERFGDDGNTFKLDSYWRTDASIFYRRDRWRVGLNFRNLFDVDYFEAGAFNLTARPGEPFTVVGSLSVTF
ncbi:MAG: TonB-dependent siderophore receptor [Cyanobacteria bacterium J06559_3]